MQRGKARFNTRAILVCGLSKVMHNLVSHGRDESQNRPLTAGLASSLVDIPRKRCYSGSFFHRFFFFFFFSFSALFALLSATFRFHDSEDRP